MLDIFVRTGMNKSSELVPQLELLKKISDTLGVLGLGELRGDIDGEIDRLKTVVERGGVANDKSFWTSPRPCCVLKIASISSSCVSRTAGTRHATPMSTEMTRRFPAGCRVGDA